VENNNLSGTLPASWSGMSSLQYLCALNFLLLLLHYLCALNFLLLLLHYLCALNFLLLLLHYLCALDLLQLLLLSMKRPNAPRAQTSSPARDTNTHHVLMCHLTTLELSVPTFSSAQHVGFHSYPQYMEAAAHSTAYLQSCTCLTLECMGFMLKDVTSS
jgi:hypothetical protein